MHSCSGLDESFPMNALFMPHQTISDRLRTASTRHIDRWYAAIEARFVRPLLGLLLTTLLLGAATAHAQLVVHNDEDLASNRPEAWAMNYMASSSLMTGFGQTLALPAWDWGLSLDIAEIPRLSAAQQRVGFDGIKQEDLNKSPVFGRGRMYLGLPGAWVAELGYTPPLTVNGVQPRDLLTIAVGRRLFERGGFTFSGRIFGQHGRARGDITCPASIAGVADPLVNPYGCQARSNDQITLDYYGFELVPAWTAGSWHGYVSGGAVRADLAVQVDAFTFDEHDRSHLVSHTTLPFATAGMSIDLDAHWNLGLQVLYVPLDVQRQPGGPTHNDPLTSARLQAVYRF
jgi:hypothetical protein